MKTQFKAKTRTEQVLTVMLILAWVAFVGYMIEAGAIVVSFVYSVIHPDAARSFYHGMNLYNLRRLGFLPFSGLVSFMVAMPVMKSIVWLLVIKTLSKINLINPFTMEVAQKLEKMSYVLFGAWILGMVSGGYTSWLMKTTGELYGEYVGGEFIFMAGLVFIISQIFKRGVELQSENELTV